MHTSHFNYGPETKVFGDTILLGLKDGHTQKESSPYIL